MSEVVEADAAAEDATEALSIVVTPVQLAAVLEEGDIVESDGTANRLFGGLKLIGGALELVAGAALIVTPEPTTATKIGGSILCVHGIDTAGSGSRELFTGRASPTLTQQVATTTALFAGVHPSRAGDIGVAVDILVPVAVSAGLAAFRAVAVRRGTLRLLHDEMLGAHTMRRHLWRSDANLLERMRDLTARAVARGDGRRRRSPLSRVPKPPAVRSRGAFPPTPRACGSGFRTPGPARSSISCLTSGRTSVGASCAMATRSCA